MAWIGRKYHSVQSLVVGSTACSSLPYGVIRGGARLSFSKALFMLTDKRLCDSRQQYSFCGINPEEDGAQREAQVSKAIAEAKDLVSTIESRGVKIGKAMYRALTGLRKPVLDKNNTLHWLVFLLYAEVMSSDFIEDFCETDMLSAHLNVMFSDSCPPLSWDQEHNYTRDAIELYYEAGSGVSLSKIEILRCLLEGTPASNVESINDEQKDAIENSIGSSSAGKGFSKWIKVNESRTLYDVLREPNLIIPGIPVFYVVSKCSSFYKEFKARNWAPPS